MYLYICVFLIYPTFVGSECNKVIVIVARKGESLSTHIYYERYQC